MKLYLLSSMKVCRGSTDEASPSLNRGTRCTQVGQLYGPDVFSLEGTRYPLDGPQTFWKIEKLRDHAANLS